MSRLNLTLQNDTLAALKKHARGRPVARLANELIVAGLERLTRQERALRLAKDYSAGRSDARELLEDFTVPSLEDLDGAGD